MEPIAPAVSPGVGLSRRSLLAGLGGITATAAVSGLVTAPHAHAATYDYTSRADFDRFLADFEASGAVGQPSDTNDAGNLAWGQAYALLGIVRMYETFKATTYLDKLITNIDQVLANRDSERGTTDYLGRSGPVWRVNDKYTAHAVTLQHSGTGDPVLSIRHATPNATPSAEIRASAQAQRFTLVLKNGSAAPLVFNDVSLDATDRASYVFTRVYRAFTASARWSVRDIRPDRTVDHLPSVGTYALQHQPYAFAVHTGQITFPIASFVRIVYSDPTLRANARYKAKADAYLAAVEAAMDFHADEYVGSEGGFGYYRWPKGAPVPQDGSILPINQYAILGAAHAELYSATGATEHKAKAQQMLAAVRGSMTQTGAASIWPYWSKVAPGSTPTAYIGWQQTGYLARDVSSFTQAQPASQQIEDVSHGAITIEFLLACYRAGLASHADTGRLARTYVDLLSVDSPPTATYRIDGTGGQSSSSANQVARWMLTASWNKGVHDHALKVVQAQALQPVGGSYVAGFAYSVWGFNRPWP